MSIKRSIQSKGDERPRKKVANNEVEQEVVVIEGSENEEADENEAGEDVEWIGDGVLDSIGRSLISEGALTSDENESGHIALKGFTQGEHHILDFMIHFHFIAYGLDLLPQN